MYLFSLRSSFFKLLKIGTLQDRDEALATVGIKAQHEVKVCPFATRL